MSNKPLFLDTTVSKEEPNEGVFEVLAHVKPEWERSQVECKNLTGGYVNKMVLCHLKTDTEITDGVVVRIHGDAGVWSRKREFIGLQIGAISGAGPRILAVFKNVLCCSYLQGRAMFYKEYQNPKIVSELVKTLVKFHSVDVDAVELYDLEGGVIVPDRNNVFWDTYDMVVGMLQPYESFKDENKRLRVISELPPLETLKSDYKKWKEEIMGLDFKTDFCHNDVHMNNLIINEKDCSVHLIDYETFGYGFQSAELLKVVGNYKQILMMMGLASEDDKEFSFDDYKKSMTLFIEEMNSKNADSPAINMERVILEGRILKEFFGIVTVIFALSSAQNPIFNLDTFEFIFHLLDGYKTAREELPHLVEEYRALRREIYSS